MLTAKQRRLIEAYADPECESKSEASRRAGYTEVQSGIRALNTPKIKAAVEKYRLDQAEEAEAGNELDKASAQQVKDKTAEVELATKEAKLAQLQPDDLVEDRKETREGFDELIQRIFKLGADVYAAQGSIGITDRLPHLADEVTTWIITDR